MKMFILGFILGIILAIMWVNPELCRRFKREVVTENPQVHRLENIIRDLAGDNGGSDRHY